MQFHDFAEFVRLFRTSRGMTQTELARRLGLKSPQLISNTERGIAVIAPARFKALAKAFQIPVEQIVDIYFHDKKVRMYETFKIKPAPLRVVSKTARNAS